MRGLVLAVLTARAAIVALAALGCSTGQEPFALPIMVVGSGTTALTAGDHTLVVTEASLSAGPFWFCASTAASPDLCPVAVAESLAVVTVDGRDATERVAGSLSAMPLTARSVMYDLGISWHGTEPTARLSADATLGRSARFRVTATRGANTFHVIADIDVKPQYQGARSVHGATTPVDLAQVKGLHVRFDPAPCLRSLDWAALEALATTSTPVALVKGTPAHSALVFGITGACAPQFEWR